MDFNNDPDTKIIKMEATQDSGFDDNSCGSDQSDSSTSKHEEDWDFDDPSKPYISEYERIRQKNIEERNRLLQSLGLDFPPPIVEKRKNPVKKRTPKKSFENFPRRESLRLKKKYSLTPEPLPPAVDSIGIWTKRRNSLVKREGDVKSRTGRLLVVPQRYLE